MTSRAMLPFGRWRAPTWSTRSAWLRAWLLAGALAAASVLPAAAVPADWHRWISRSGSRVVVCARTSPGTGWEIESGPYLEPNCQVRRRTIRP